jgi:signal transduction histidine kinase
MEVTLSCRKNEKSYEMIVKDKGRGMTEDQLANIGAYLQFEREKYEQQGMGLGLTISMKIIEFYGGKIITNSKYGEQTEIIVTVPLVQN